MPTIVSAQGYPTVSTWASYSDALAGSAVYAVRMSAAVGRWLVIQGNLDPHVMRNASVIGAQYAWDRAAVSQTASLLWTAHEPFTPAAGWSGSVLCLGRPTDQSSRAVAFQNFEVLCSGHINSRTGRPEDIIVKGAFMLPESIRASAIISSHDDHRQRDADTLPRHNLERRESDRRIFSAE